MRKNYTPIIKSLTSNLKSLGLLLACIGGTAITTGAYAQGPVYGFSTAGQTGPTGPTNGQVTSAYALTNLNGLVTASGGIQSFTVPTTGPYRITAVGAQGGNGGGYAASVTGDYTLTAGTVLKILVGQQGTTNNNGANISGGGGGGSYVTGNTNVPYVIAGGGGGNASGYNNTPNVTPCCLNGMEANLTMPGRGTAPQTTGGTPLSNGGSNGSGGTCGSFLNAGGGAGLTGDGSQCDAGSRAMAFINGGAAGLNGGGQAGDGGFGGGGGCYNSGTGERGGGGGGYSGGGGGVADGGYDAAAGGGGSYNSGASPNASITTSGGNGKVVISFLCDVIISTSTTNSVAPAICTGGSATLTTNAVSNYTWSNGATTTSIVVNPTSSTIYTVYGTSALGCSNAYSINLVVNSGSPTVSVVSTTPSICSGNTVMLTASGALTYTFANAGVTSAVPFMPNATAIYSVTGTNGCGTASATIGVTLVPLPVTGVSTSTLLCSGSPATLTAGGANSFTWMPGSSNLTNITVNPLSNTVYTLIGKTGNCSNTVTINVQTNPLPTMSITASSTLLCQGGNVNLSVTGSATSYTWNPGGQTGTNISPNLSASTPFYVTGRDVNNCINTAYKVVAVNPAPVISVSASNTMICAGSPATLTANGASTYSWVGSPSSSVAVVNPAASGNYIVNATSAQGCTATAAIFINVFTPQITVSSNTAICSGGSTMLSADGAQNYVWLNDNSTNQALVVSPTANTTYTVSGMVNNQAGLNCAASGMITVTVNPLPVISAVSDPSVICAGKSTSLTVSGAGANGTYTWTTGSQTEGIYVSPGATQSYNVAGTDANGCKGSTAVQVVVSPCTGINTIAANTVDVLVYPNPANGEFTISSTESITLHIVNELGQQVKVITLGTTTPAVKVNNLANGVYFISGTNENGSVKQKIVIAK